MERNTRGTEAGDTRPLDADQRDTIEKTSAPLMGAGGAAAGATAGTLILGPVGTGVGAILGALAGAVGGWWAGQSVVDTARYTEEDDRHYRMLHERAPGRASHDFERARHSYVLGHLAAHNPEYHRREFDEVEPDLRRAWKGDLASHGQWETMQPYARDAYGHARSTGAGAAAHRDTTVIGTAGSAVDPDELRESLSHPPRHIVDPGIV
jgi:hypothetical protein